MGYYGHKRVTFVIGDRSELQAMEFHATDVRRPLAAVNKIVDAGNIVQFGPREEDNFIERVEGGGRVKIRRKGAPGFARQV